MEDPMSSMTWLFIADCAINSHIELHFPPHPNNYGVSCEHVGGWKYVGQSKGVVTHVVFVKFHVGAK